MIFSAVRKMSKENDNIFNMFDYESFHPDDDITFDEAVTNIGNGMDADSGVFTAPVSGIYTFSFAAKVTTMPPALATIQVLKGGKVEFYFGEFNHRQPILDFEGIIHSWMMSLVQNEEVHLKMDEKSERFLVNPENKNFIWFNGQLLYPSE